MLNQAFAAGLPLTATEIARQWDQLYLFLVWVSVFFFILTVGGMVWFAIKYRTRPGLKAKYITGSHLLEAIWTLIPGALLLVIFAWGYVVYNRMTQAPTDAYEIRVIGKQWLWTFQYNDGRTTVNELYVPINKPVKLIMSSEDVLHSFFIPNFRVKQDVVPGMYSSVWFEATVPGRHQVYCTEYCGTSHSEMLAQLIALDEQQWQDWQRGKKLPPIPKAGMTLAESQAAEKGQLVAASAPPSLAEQGKRVSEMKGCVACHSADGSTKVGPTYKGIFGKDVELADGSKVKVDEAYIRESIENPQAKIVKGFGPVMPTFKGLLTEAEINAVIEYIKSLK